jgi:organic hydroperoxide reductase OsmC/OhrA
MSTHTATVTWTRDGAVFTDRKYGRAHRWTFDGGAVVHAAASPANVRVPMTDPAGVDPEEAFTAALSSCHMLWFLDFAARAGFTIDLYVDVAECHCAKTASGHDWVDRVTLRPEVVFSGKSASDDQVAHLHHQAHEACHLANSVRSEIVTTGTWRMAE